MIGLFEGENMEEDDDIRLVIVERCIDLPKKLATFGSRIGKCEGCEQDIWVSKASDSYMSKYSDEKIKILCKPCWEVMDKEEDEDRDVIATEETLKEFDDWYLSHYGYKPTREQTFEMMEHYIGKRPKITK